MGQVIEVTEYTVAVDLPEGFKFTDEFWELFPMGAKTETINGTFYCNGFELESDAETALVRIEEMTNGSL